MNLRPNPDPGGYSRRVLVATVGLCPQIVTETIYALTVGRRKCNEPEWMPTEIWMITTGLGAELAQDSLLRCGWLDRLCKREKLPLPAFENSHILTLKGGDGSVLDDAHDTDALLGVGDLLVQCVGSFVDNFDTAVHVSIAGGRKGMSHLAGQTMALLAGPPDRLSHVLVSPGFEDSDQFFFPSQGGRVEIQRRDRGRLRVERVDAAMAQVTLADVPFLRLHDTLPDALLADARRGSFKAIVEAANQALQPPHLIFLYGDEHESPAVVCNGVSVPMTARAVAFYLAVARRGRSGLRADDMANVFKAMLQAVIDVTPAARVLYDRDGTLEKEGDAFARSAYRFANVTRPLKLPRIEVSRVDGNALLKQCRPLRRSIELALETLGVHLAQRFAVTKPAEAGGVWRLPDGVSVSENGKLTEFTIARSDDEEE